MPDITDREQKTEKEKNGWRERENVSLKGQSLYAFLLVLERNRDKRMRYVVHHLPF